MTDRLTRDEQSDDLAARIRGVLRIFFADDRYPTPSEKYLIDNAALALAAELRAAPAQSAAPPIDGPDPLRVAMAQACDLLAERTYGHPARSPGHNARLVLEAALQADKQEVNKP